MSESLNANLLGAGDPAGQGATPIFDEANSNVTLGGAGQTLVGARNVIVGAGAGEGAVNTSDVVMVGALAGKLGAGDANVFIGSSSAASALAGSARNVVVGKGAAEAAFTLRDAVIVGALAASSALSVQRSVVVGTGVAASQLSDVTCVGGENRLGASSRTVAVGRRVHAYGDDVVAMGADVFIGESDTAVANGCVTVGREVRVLGEQNLVVGSGVTVEKRAIGNVVVGNDVRVPFGVSNAVALAPAPGVPIQNDGFYVGDFLSKVNGAVTLVGATAGVNADRIDLAAPVVECTGGVSVAGELSVRSSGASPAFVARPDAVAASVPFSVTRSDGSDALRASESALVLGAPTRVLSSASATVAALEDGSAAFFGDALEVLPDRVSFFGGAAALRLRGDGTVSVEGALSGGSGGGGAVSDGATFEVGATFEQGARLDLALGDGDYFDLNASAPLLQKLEALRAASADALRDGGTVVAGATAFADGVTAADLHVTGTLRADALFVNSFPQLEVAEQLRVGRISAASMEAVGDATVGGRLSAEAGADVRGTLNVEAGAVKLNDGLAHWRLQLGAGAGELVARAEDGASVAFTKSVGGGDHFCRFEGPAPAPGDLVRATGAVDPPPGPPVPVVAVCAEPLARAWFGVAVRAEAAGSLAREWDAGFARGATPKDPADVRVVVRASGLAVASVVGSGGDVAIGDLLCSSATPGAMERQADQTVRGPHTVARALQAATFAAPTDAASLAVSVSH